LVQLELQYVDFKQQTEECLPAADAKIIANNFKTIISYAKWDK
jgi:hypothetical protein